MKKAKVTTASAHGITLPPDAVQRVALFIPDAADFFNYLDAFQGTSTSLGHLQHLWTASFHAPFHMLWPELHLDQVSAFRVASLQPDRSYFQRIHVHAVFDLDILRGCVATTNVLALYTCPLANEVDVPLQAWYRQLATLPIGHLTWLQGRLVGRPQSMNQLLEVLPQMTNLTSLDLSHACVSSTDNLLAFIRDSKLTQLCLQDVSTLDPVTSEPSNHPTTMSPQGLSSLTHWLATQPVTRFGLSNWILPSNPKVLSHFYRALWTCPTLRSLSAHNQPLPRLENFECSVPLALRQLSLTRCDLGSEDVRALAIALRNSTVTWLNLSDNPQIGPGGTHALAAVGLRMSVVTTLLLNNVGMGSLGCSFLAHFLGDTVVTELSVDSNDIDDGGVLFLGYVMRMTPRLRSLSMRRNDISISGAANFLHSLEQRQQDGDQAPLVIDLDHNPIDDADQDSLNAMASEQLPPDAVFSCVSDFNPMW
ncbi:hypothetical protein AaE_016226 [Aphanomyces astaci]|uniref:RNI-like protein n=1 Tax=Aphanomyces astaci TaxID=112090 RepID=A0A6A4YX78_APHAT|nr:hypothetical protein AaE_016226 [Aphanomyces astaci]